ncbi:MAG: NAD(P)-dependent oxidoreductase [Thermotogae bacterium]|nr:NAD(P)-dependent oxidoreductase [Thermotogota bacterium]
MIAILGSTGTLGRALRDRLKTGKFHSRDDFDLRNTKDASRFLDTFLENVNVVINAAAYTDVDGAERDPVSALLVNAQFPKLLASWCRRNGVRLIHVSSDYVFDGRVGFYAEDSLPQPLGVYGKSKLLGEIYVLEEFPEAVVVRTSWLFGPGGRNFLSRLPLKLIKGEDIYAHDEQVSVPTYSPFLAQVLLEMVENFPRGGIYHVVGSVPTTPFRAALLLASDLGSGSRLHQLPAGVAMKIRPRSSVLLSTRLDLKPVSLVESVRSYLKKLNVTPLT